MSATTERDAVIQMASSNPENALRRARGIDEPWFRCQALTFVAAAENDPKARERLVREALSAADEQSEPNRIVTVSAWPLRVMSRSGTQDALEKEVRRLLGIIATEPHAVRRADALFMLLDKLRDGPREVFLRLLDAFQAACLAMPAKAKKKEWLMRNGVEIAATVAPQRARALADLIHRPMLRRQAFEALERHGVHGQPAHRQAQPDAGPTQP